MFFSKVVSTTITEAKLAANLAVTTAIISEVVSAVAP